MKLLPVRLSWRAHAFHEGTPEPCHTCKAAKSASGEPGRDPIIMSTETSHTVLGSKCSAAHAGSQVSGSIRPARAPAAAAERGDPRSRKPD